MEISDQNGMTSSTTPVRLELSFVHPPGWTLSIGHFYFAQIGHYHFAATLAGDTVPNRICTLIAVGPK